ncbi:MAG: isopentenyl phosphate kinase [Infirmifilum uzonense]|uniref:isopentenyl phosphate kinase n=1 Tax=Infirmifilum uzonense TaxID=1550241 RepID=UPI003C75929C
MSLQCLSRKESFSQGDFEGAEGMLAVIKVGGSAITDKNSPYTLRENNLKTLSERIANLYSKGVSLLIVHGGGSFGHPTAAKYGLSAGGISLEKAFGFAETRYWMSYLNLQVVEKLLSKGIPAVGIQTSAIAVSMNGIMRKLDVEIVRMFLERLTVPVLYGDAVIDTVRGLSILSGDDIASYLAVELKADTLVFVMGSGGVYDRPPGQPGAKLLPAIRPGSTLPESTETGIDVTGGLAHKLECAFKAVKSGVRVAIGGLQYLEEMVYGIEAPYTRVLPD